MRKRKNEGEKSSYGATHMEGQQAAGSVATKLANAGLPDWICAWEAHAS